MTFRIAIVGGGHVGTVLALALLPKGYGVTILTCLTRWRDNVFVERLWRSVKGGVPASLRQRQRRPRLGRPYLDFCNARRPHQSLDDATPDQAYFNQPPVRLAA
jgi:hypothetical protein